MRWKDGIGRAGMAVVAAVVLGCSSDGGSGPSQTATTIAVASGSVQSGTVGSTLPTPVGVRVSDAAGDPVAGIAVTFAVTAGGGSMAAAAPVTTNAQGEASTTWTIGTVAGANNNVATATAAGLSGSPVTFRASGNPGAPVEVVAVSGNNQNAQFFQLAAAPLVAQVNDAYGNPVPGVALDWSLSGGGSMSAGTGPTNAMGQASVTRTIGGTMSGYLTTATIPGGSIAKTFVTLGTAVPSTYNVEVVFLTPVTASQRTAFLDAAARWSSIVVSGFAPDQVIADAKSCSDNTPAIDQVITSVLIYATIAPIDGPGQILGGAFPCWVRVPGYLTLVGDMMFDVADMATLEAQNLLKPVILHEMGHALGYGAIWDYLTPSLLVNGGTLDPYFNGAAAISYFNAAGGAGAYGGAPVPVENTGGPGTADGHWRTSVMTPELMVGFIASAASGNPLSAITIGSMDDIGYTVSYATADPYLFSAPPAGAPAMAQGLQMRELERTGPIHGVDRQGRITRVR